MIRVGLLIAMLGLLATPALAAKGGPVLHKVAADGETYAAIADHYYGKRYLERHLRLFNRKREPLKRNTTILVPTYRFVPAKSGQTLSDFAKAYLNDPQRAGYLAAVHGLKRERIPSKKRLKVVQSLAHIVRPGESLKSIARTYYREATANRLKLLRLYNKMADDRVRVGMTLRIPLDSKEFSDRRVAERAAQPFDPLRTPTPPTLAKAPAPPVRKSRARGRNTRRAELRKRRAADAARAEQNLETAERLYDDGAYEECAKFTHDAIEAQSGSPKGAKVELLRVSAFALVALGRYQESRRQFQALVEVDPNYELDLYQTSPKILDIFESVAER